MEAKREEKSEVPAREGLKTATQSDSIKNLASALVKAQSEYRGAKKDADNPFFKSKYSDLNSIWESIREPFTKNGLCIIQTTEIQVGELGVKTLLIHTSGEWISGFLPLTEKPQVTGSALSYARRYGLSAITGSYSEDDDGEKATNRQSTPYFNPPAKPPVVAAKKPAPRNYDGPPPFDPQIDFKSR